MFATEEQALKTYEGLIAAKQKKGYLLVADVKPAEVAEVRNRDLEEAMWSDLDNPNAWANYGTFLEAQGDVRGQIIRRFLAGDDDGAEALQRKNMAVLAGKELLAVLGKELSTSCFSATWRFGFLETVRVSSDYEEEDESCPRLLKTVLKSPASRFLRELRIGLNESDGENPYHKVIKVLTGSGRLSALRYLHVGDFEYPDDTEISWTEVGNVAGIYAVAPNLETLILTGGLIELGLVQHPRLKRLKLETGGLPGAATASVGAADLPNLEELEMWLGTSEYGGTTTIDHLKPLLSGRGLPRLKKLGIKNADIQDEIAGAVAVSPLLARIEELDMSMGTMHKKGAQAILEHTDQFQHLSSLDLSENFISETLCQKLKAAFGERVNLNDQEEADENDGEPWTYTTVGE